MTKARRAQPLERLVDADPIWVGTGPNNTVSPNRHGIGVQFDCPIHEDCLCYVPFTNPLDGGAPVDFRPPAAPPSATWGRSGETFETLTLAPSIRRLGPECFWHGFIRGGRFETCGDAR